MFLPIWIFSQNKLFEHFTTVEGISHNEVRKIVKDTDGFLWFGTQNGLNRFDGYHFKIFKHNSNDEASIVDNRIYDMTASKDKLWVGTVSGISVINTKTQHVITPKSLMKAVGYKQILDLFYDGDTSVWLSTLSDNFIVNTTTFKVEKVLEDYNIQCISKGINGKLWIGTNKGLLYYDSQQKSILKVYNIGRFNAYSLDNIYTNTLGEVWITLDNDVYRFQSERNRFVKVYESKSLNAITENKEGTLFFGSYGQGVVSYNRETGEFSAIKANPLISTSLSSNDVYDVFVDEGKNLWVGTQEGLDYYDFSKHKFNSIVHIPDKDNSLRSSFVQSLSGDNEGNLLVGTRSGIDKISFENDNKDFKIEGHLKSTFDNQYINAVFLDSSNRLWISSGGKGVYLYENENNRLQQFINIPEDVNSIVSNNVNSITEDHLGNLWFGTNSGVSVLHLEPNGKYSFENIYQVGNNIKFEAVYSILEDRQHRIWIGMNKRGVVLLDTISGKNQYINFKHDPKNAESLSSNEVFVIYQDSKDRIWFGTSSGGVNLLQEKQDSTGKQTYFFKSYTEANGLGDNEINSILEDESGNLWISTNKGLSKFNPDSETFFNYSTYDGVLKGKFRKNANWKDQQGNLYFGGAAGINYFNPKNFRQSKAVSIPFFSSLKIDEKEVLKGDKLGGEVVLSEALESGSEVRLSLDYNRFSLYFTTLSYTSTYRNQYMYKMEGVDKEWKKVTGDNPHANYSNIPIGKHRLYLKACNNEGVWNTNPIYLDVIVKGPLWEGRSFKIAIGLVLVLLFVFVFLMMNRFKYHQGKNNSGKVVEKKFSKPITEEMDAENKKLIEVLQHIMQTEQLYLDSELSLNGLAEKLEISSNHLSMLLNDYIGKNFYDYVNCFRVEEVKKRLVDKAYEKQTISSIGGDCGFNSKSTFNRIFKNTTGITPSQYQKQNT
ncbi:sensor histidine kinase [Aestuariibaculum suncheonense]